MVLSSILWVVASSFLIFLFYKKIFLFYKKKCGYFLTTEPKKAETARKLFSQFSSFPQNLGPKVQKKKKIAGGSFCSTLSLLV